MSAVARRHLIDFRFRRGHPGGARHQLHAVHKLARQHGAPADLPAKAERRGLGETGGGHRLACVGAGEQLDLRRDPALLAEYRHVHDIEDAIERGYRVGITAGADGVYGRPGADHPGWRQNRNVRSGLTGVYATALDKTSLWEAFAARRCFGTTGERISLWADVEGVGMGGQVDVEGDEVAVHVRVAGTAALERIDILRRTEVVACRQLAGPSPDGALRVLWMGARRRGAAADQRVIWDGDLGVDVGRFTEVSPVNFQSAADVTRIEPEGRRLIWTSATAGNRAGIVFHFDGPDETVLSLRTPPCSFDLTAGTIRSGVSTFEAGGLKRRVEIGPAPDEAASPDADLRINIPVQPGGQAVWVRVIQTDGAMAWSSPVVVTGR